MVILSSVCYTGAKLLHRLKWLQSGMWLYLDKVVVIGQKWLYSVKVVVCGQK